MSRSSFRECLICGMETNATHMGIDACRACTVFYRRSLSRTTPYLCGKGKGKCIDHRRGVYSCKRCRFDRFKQVLRDCRADDELILSSPPLSEGSPSSRGPTSVASSVEGSSIIDTIQTNYQLLNIVRRTSELALRGEDIDPIDAVTENFPIIPCTYQIMNQATRILVSALFDFAGSTFPEFKELNEKEQWLLIRGYQKIFHIMDAVRRSEKKFGRDFTKGFGTYTTYLDLEHAEYYFSDCPNTKNVRDATRTLKECLVLNSVCTEQKRFHTPSSEDEYIALLGLTFWSYDTTTSSEHEVLEKLASKYRSMILNDLNERIKRSEGETQAAIRIGELFCSMEMYKRGELNLAEEYEVYRILNVFDDDTFMYKMQYHRPELIE